LHSFHVLCYILDLWGDVEKVEMMTQNVSSGQADTNMKHKKTIWRFV